MAGVFASCQPEPPPTQNQHQSTVQEPPKQEARQLRPRPMVIKIQPRGPSKVVFSQEDYYPLSGRDVGVEKSNGKLFLEIYSFKLQKFMQGEVFPTKLQTQIFALNNSSTQITNIEGQIDIYKYSQKKQKVANINAIYQRYTLTQKTPTRFEIAIQAIPPYFNVSNCRIVIRKQLIDTFTHSREVMINLDFKRELRNKAVFNLFLECPK
ncbi:cell surface protein [Helicobacter mehlei]|uniref:Cell surface protein n=2 Tax=Helicobacter mehlei TaxID=2316080 RepID=A0A553UQF8_9HELI|nr:cell surface protein [Helicobacter mehlei]